MSHPFVDTLVRGPEVMAEWSFNPLESSLVVRVEVGVKLL